MFENVAKDYDLMNDVMSLAVHRIWKDYFMMKLSVTESTKLVDVAGGTGKKQFCYNICRILIHFISGDIAFRFINSVNHSNLKNCHVTVCDINKNMLEVGKLRSQRLHHDPTVISWQESNAEDLPFDDNSFNAYTIAFGIRNCTHIDTVLEEAYRVLQPGGRFLCLEFSQLENNTAQWYVLLGFI